MLNRDERWMQRALALARRGEGMTRPNPPVGAVIVRGGRVVGEGYHRRAGGPHAEVVALRQAGAQARGATLYVTLEPCSTWGRTPPCTDAIREAGIRRVVVAARDPNPRHAGRGLRLLRRRGVSITEGPGAVDAAALLEPFAAWITRQRPRVTLKLGLTLDGRLADAQGRSRWITGPAARRMVHALRRRADAIMVGSTTALRDNPSLLPVPALGRKPLRVVVDRRGRVPLRSRLFTDGEQTRTLLATSRSCPKSHRLNATRCGAEVLLLPGRADGVDLDALLRELGRRGLLHVVCEGGGRLAGALLKAGLVDEAWFFMAPRVLGAHGVPAVAGVDWDLAVAPAFHLMRCERVGSDVLLVLRR